MLTYDNTTGDYLDDEDAIRGNRRQMERRRVRHDAIARKQEWLAL